MANTTKYITTGGERWDQIAAFAYGDENKMGDLMIANPNVPKYVVFPQGVEINIPVLIDSDSNDLILPPWKR